MKKRKQHYVWEHYLTGWARDGRVWCRQGPRCFCTSTENVAQERDFYRLEEISEADLDFVERVAIEPLDENLKEMARGWVAPFTEVFAIRRLYEAQERKLPELESELDIAINNIEEDLHSAIESLAVPLLAELRAARTEFLSDDENFMHFARFIAAQYMRTPSIMTRSLDAVAGMLPGFNIAASWGLLRTIYATNIGYALFRRRTMLVASFLDAAESTEFITGDQPMVNVRAGAMQPEVPPTELELFYPLSPKLGVMLRFDGERRATRRQLSAEETSSLNARIARSSLKQLYAASEAALANLVAVGRAVHAKGT